MYKYYLDTSKESKDMIIGAKLYVVLDEMWNDQYITCYQPIGQHGGISPLFIDELTEITKEEYVEMSKGYFTPEEYL